MDRQSCPHGSLLAEIKKRLPLIRNEFIGKRPASTELFICER